MDDGGDKMPSQFNIQLNVALLQSALERYDPAIFKKKLRAGMSESLEYLKGQVVQITPVNTGQLRGSIFQEIRGTEANLRGLVASPLKYGTVVEFGRRPGQRMPPVTVIERWAQLHGMAGLGWPIARAIAKRGIPGKHMFENAARNGKSKVESIFRRHIESAA